MLPHTFIIGAMCFFWCKSNARERGITPPSGTALLSGLVAPIGISAYLVRTWGWKAGLPKVGKAFLFGIVAVAMNYFASVATLKLT
jgi:hypothetical protein